MEKLIEMGIPKVLAEDIYTKSLADCRQINAEHLLDYAINCRLELYNHNQKHVSDRKNARAKLNTYFIKA